MSHERRQRISEYSLVDILNGKIWGHFIASVGAVLHVNIKLGMKLVYSKTKLLYSTIYLSDVLGMEPGTSGLSSSNPLMMIIQSATTPLWMV